MLKLFKYCFAYRCLFVLLALCQISVAQTKFADTSKNNPVCQYRQHLKARVIPVKIPVFDPAQKTNNLKNNPDAYTGKVSDIITQALPELRHPAVGIMPIQTPKISLSGARHYTTRQTLEGIEVYGSHIQAAVGKQGDMYLLNALVFDVNNLTQYPNTHQPINRQAIEQFLADKFMIILPQNNVSMLTTLFFASPNVAQLAVKVVAETPDHMDYREFVFAANGQLLYDRDLTHHYRNPKHQPKDKNETTAQAQAYVFNPDPLTSAQKQYGVSANYRDNNDNDNSALTAQRVLRNIEVSFFNGKYVLENNHVKIVEYESPVVEPVNSTELMFDYTRSQSGFEDVNAFYHANTFYDYIHTLGFADMDNQMVWIDTHAENGDDQSRHRYAGGNKHIITHGEGGVDDAEDADVIVHEYTHGVSYSACEDCNAGFEREAIDEAVCDYFATGYSRRISEFRWQDMFTWDGHNPYFSGRDMDNNKHYPEDIVADEIYPTSLIFSGAMMDIWEAIGGGVSDSLMLEALQNFTPGINMKDAAEIIIQADQQLFNGNNYDALCYWFSLRGLYNGTCNYVLEAGQDQSVCLGDTLLLGGTIIPPIDGKIYWSPAISLNDSTLLHPTASPDKPTLYVVTLIDNVANITLHDTVFVNTAYCIDNTNNNEVMLLNSDRFVQGRGDLIVLLPHDTQNAAINVFNSIGQTLGRYAVEDNTNQYVLLDSAAWSNGLYIIEVKADGLRYVFKAIKGR